MTIKLTNRNESKLKARAKVYGGTPTLIANHLLTILFEHEEKLNLESLPFSDKAVMGRELMRR